MDWSEILKIVLAVMAGFGGVSGIIILVIKFSSNFIAKRLQEKYSLKLNKELEKYKSGLENKTYISKTKFDVEFEIYRELSKAVSNVVRDSSLMISIFAIVPADIEERKQHDTKLYNSTIDSLIKAQNILHSNIPFVSSMIVEKYEEILNLCTLQCRAFARRWNLSFRGSYEEKSILDDKDYERTKEINKKFKQINETVRSYLSNLDVVN